LDSLLFLALSFGAFVLEAGSFEKREDSKSRKDSDNKAVPSSFTKEAPHGLLSGMAGLLSAILGKESFPGYILKGLWGTVGLASEIGRR
jgi:hypothetical protein